MTKRTGGQILVDQLKIQGCERVFTVPGESFLAVLDAAPRRSQNASHVKALSVLLSDASRPLPSKLRRAPSNFV